MNEKRFDTLDGLRGIAAIMVMLFHAGTRLPVRAPGGYLAVDLFFALSGFVIALAYEDRLRQGFPFSRFLIVRLIRSYPMYLVGILIGGYLYTLNPIHLLMLPDFADRYKLYPANVPMWSLIFELVVNLAYAAVATKLGNRVLVAVLLISGSAFAYGIIEAGKADLGAFWSGAAMGLIRTIFAFSLGVGIYRIRAAMGMARRQTWLGWLLYPLLIAVLMFAPKDRTWWDIAAVFAILPGIIWLGTFWEIPHPAAPLWLGHISYPFYCIHGPILWLHRGTVAETLATIAGIIAAAWALNRWVDPPMRRLLSAWLLPAKPKAA